LVFPVIGWFQEDFTEGPFPRPIGTPGANMGTTFGGYTDLSRNLVSLTTLATTFNGAKYITFGGGGCVDGPACQWDRTVIANLQSSIINNQIPSIYVGIGFNIEEALNKASGLLPNFKALFQAAKSKGYLVFVTVSGNAPYDFSDNVLS